MGTFRTLSAADVQTLLAGFGLDGYRSHSAIAVGTINTNVAVETTHGRYFLRINEGKAKEEVAREAGILAHVTAAGVPTPRPLLAPTGEAWVKWQGAYATFFPWVSGRTISRTELTPEQAGQVGRALGALHRAGATYPDHRASRYEPQEIDRRLESVARDHAHDGALQVGVRRLSGELTRLRTARVPNLPLGLIHGDLFIDNVLFVSNDADGTGEVVLLDFEQAAWGRLAYDVAVSVLAFGFGREDFRAETTRALLEGYAQIRPFVDPERAGFADELRFAACRFAVTRITDVYLRRSEGAPPGKDYRRYLQRLECIAHHVGRSDGLLEPP